MIIKVRIGKWRFTWSMAPLTDVVGVNSNLPNGNHILMWDLDETNITTVTKELRRIQNKHSLPTIYILQTKPKQNYIAYCFKICTWRKTVEIIAATKGVDWNFFKYGVYRGKFTLRVGPKSGRWPKLITYLLGKRKANTLPEELKSWIKYETLENGWVSKLHEWGVTKHGHT